MLTNTDHVSLAADASKRQNARPSLVRAFARIIMPPERTNSRRRSGRYLKASDPLYEGRMVSALGGMRDDTYKSQREAARKENVSIEFKSERALYINGK